MVNSVKPTVGTVSPSRPPAAGSPRGGYPDRLGRWPTVVLWIVGLVAAGRAVDRALIACELRGWILYRLTPRPRHEMRRAAGSTLIGIDGLFRPAARHVATVTRQAAVHRDGSDQGDGPETLQAP
jgi:hypothetical protein